MHKNSKLLALYNEVWFFFFMLNIKIRVKLGLYEDKEITPTRYSWFLYRNREYLSKTKKVSIEQIREDLKDL